MSNGMLHCKQQSTVVPRVKTGTEPTKKESSWFTTDSTFQEAPCFDFDLPPPPRAYSSGVAVHMGSARGHARSDLIQREPLSCSPQAIIPPIFGSVAGPHTGFVETRYTRIDIVNHPIQVRTCLCTGVMFTEAGQWPYSDSVPLRS